MQRVLCKSQIFQELEDHMSKYTDLHRDYEKIRDRYEQELSTLKQRLQEAAAENAEKEDIKTCKNLKLSSASRRFIHRYKFG